MKRFRCDKIHRIPSNIRVYTQQHASRPPIISIKHGTFYRNHPSAELEQDIKNPPIFPELEFQLPSERDDRQDWAIVGPSNAGKTTFLEVLQGKHICIPPRARSFPYLAHEEVDPLLRSTARAIRYVGFSGDGGGVGKSGARGAYMSARYESRREGNDFSVLNYLEGNIELNPAEGQLTKSYERSDLEKVVEDLQLRELLDMPMGNLSNGQIRRARIAKVLLGKPLVLLLDEPFMGLDPPTTMLLSRILEDLVEQDGPRMILALRPQDQVPTFITHLTELTSGMRVTSSREVAHEEPTLDNQVQRGSLGPYSEGFSAIHLGLPRRMAGAHIKGSGWQRSSREGLNRTRKERDDEPAESVIEMQDVHVKYGEKEVLGGWEIKDKDSKHMKQGLWWNVKKGDRWGVFGPNGSGKTTLISLICSDHPLSYSLPVKVFGRSRLPEPGKPGISVFDLQARIGQSSPEVHAFFPKKLSVRQVIENAWADTFLGTPKLKYENDLAVDACLRWFEAELNPMFDPLNSPTRYIRRTEFATFRDTDWADNLQFGDCPFSAQRVALFLRAIVKRPEIIILDEAFSGMDEYVRDKCMLFLTWGETRNFVVQKDRTSDQKRRTVAKSRKELHDVNQLNMFEGLGDDQTLICVSHIKEEVPGILEDWISLPEAGTGKPARFGKFGRPLDLDYDQWDDVWRPH